MSDCTHDCSSCGESCAQRESKPEDFLVKLSKGSSVKKVTNNKGVISVKTEQIISKEIDKILIEIL